MVEEEIFEDGKLDKLDVWIREINLDVKEYIKRHELIEEKREANIPKVRQVEGFFDSISHELYQNENKEIIYTTKKII